MQREQNDLDARLQNAMFGLPVLNPDEQHRYLGTFHERIELRITFEQALRYDFTPARIALFKNPITYQLLLHGQLDMDVMGRYIRLANQQQVRFAIKNSQFYHHIASSSAIILCTDHAIDRETIDAQQRYPKIVQS